MKYLKTINNLDPNLMQKIFTPKSYTRIQLNNILVKKHHLATYGDKSLLILGP